MKEYKYLKEEYHRGEWKPLMIKEEKSKERQAYVLITEEQAYWMNRNSNEKRIRYVLKVDKKEKTIKDTYTEEVGKKPFGGWSDEVVLEKLEEFRKTK